MRFFARAFTCMAFMLWIGTTYAQEKALSSDEKIYGLSKFWEEASYNFAYFDNVPTLNFDSLYRAYIPKVTATKTDYDYYRVMQQFCAFLHDGHTYILYPKSLMKQIVTPQIVLNRIGDEVYITNTGLKYKESIPIGSKILEVDGIKLLTYLNEEVYPYFTASTEHIRINAGAKTLLKGLAGSSVKIKIQKPGKQVATVEIIRENLQEAWVKPVSTSSAVLEFKMLQGGIGLLSLNSFAEEKIVKEFKDRLPEIRKSKGLIIDVRNNGGGIGTYAFEIVKHLTDQPGFITLASSTRKHLADRKATGALSDTALTNAIGIDPIQVEDSYKDYFAGRVWEQAPLDTIKNDVTEPKLLMPLVILTSNRTVSAAEDFLIAMENVHRGIRVGQPTKGSTGQPLFMKLPGGGLAAICTRRNTYADGRKFVGVGVVPDVKVELGLDDYLSGKDNTLDKALQVMQQELKKHSAHK